MQVLFLERKQSNAWVNKSDDAFGGETALRVILTDKNDGILRVATYLYIQLQVHDESFDKSVRKEFILTLILEWVGSTEDALNWYVNEPIPAMGMTSLQAVESGEYEGVLKYLKHISLGGHA